jgi:hypothetical protein
MDNLTNVDILPPKKQTKYEYWLVIQQHYGQGWEDVSHYEADSQGTAKEYNDKVLINKFGREYREKLITHDAREYRLTGYATRIIFRKELRTVNS